VVSSISIGTFVKEELRLQDTMTDRDTQTLHILVGSYLSGTDYMNPQQP